MLKSNKLYIFMYGLLYFSLFFIDFSINSFFSIKPYMIVMTLVLVVHVYLSRGFIKNKTNNFDKLILLFFAYVFIRNFFAEDLISSIKGTFALMLSIILYFTVKVSFSKIKPDYIFRIIYYMSIVISITIFLGHLFEYKQLYEVDRGIYRLRAYIQDPNFFVLFLTPSLIISIYFFFKNKPIGLIVNALLFFLAYSRAAYLSVVIPLLLVILVIQKNKVLNIKNVSFIILVILGLAIYVNLTKSGHMMYQTIKVNILQRFSETASSGARKTLLNSGFQIFRNNPIFGIGQLNSKNYISHLGNNYLHNTYLDVLVEFGIVGFVVFGFLLVSLLMIKSKNIYSQIFKIIIIMQLSLLFFLTGLNNESLYFSLGTFMILNKDKV